MEALYCEVQTDKREEDSQRVQEGDWLGHSQCGPVLRMSGSEVVWQTGEAKWLTQRPPIGLTPSQAPTRRPYISAQSDGRAPPPPPHPSMAFPYTPIRVGGSRGGVRWRLCLARNTFLLCIWGRAPHQVYQYDFSNLSVHF